ncbi:hypothetical protein WP50_38175 [Lactiplantibacillus plantarum]|nr:hypothetical protein WP50_38165 [Lactiplantibacillus plantarum]KLD56816.1 hypothetical protein WP50_38175 [Lactiplantibacillus plantarum]
MGWLLVAINLIATDLNGTLLHQDQRFDKERFCQTATTRDIYGMTIVVCYNSIRSNVTECHVDV